jgi:hypothetical protein
VSRALTPADRALAQDFAGAQPFEVEAGGAVKVVRAANSFDAALDAMTEAGGRVVVSPAALRLVRDAAAYERALQLQIDRPDLLTLACTGRLL